jgi:hypothetical protein
MRTLTQNRQWREDRLLDEGQLNFEELFSFNSDGQTDAQSDAQRVDLASLDFVDLWSRPEEFLATLRSLFQSDGSSSDEDDPDGNDSDEDDSDENDTDDDEEDNADDEDDDSDENDADDDAESDSDENENN